ncbi:MAG TPA: hypothetical protein VFS52_20535 [Steroidobacteraceae bacterium]|nr:hypothetical protein [Steroidobacteraceae bacterium]
MRQLLTTRWWVPALLCAAAYAGAEEASPPSSPPPEPPPAPQSEQNAGPQPNHDAWLDRTQQGVKDMVSKSAERLDRLFGPEEDEEAYDAVTGSIAPALLWDEFEGWQPKLRFHVDVPLPQLDHRWHAFIGRVNRDEYVSERDPQSGAFERQYGPESDEQTLAGITFHTPEKQGSHFDAGAGVRLRFPLDPYLKGSFVYELGKSETGLMSLRQTVFWQNSERLGFTTRADLEKYFDEKWLVRWTTSATISQNSEGVFGYSAVRALRGLPHRRAVAVEVGFDGATDQEVPLHEYGIKAAYRQSVIRDWLILEVRSSFTYPKDFRWQSRKPSWGVGLGFEMFFGTDEFLARPVTF